MDKDKELELVVCALESEIKQRIHKIRGVSTLRLDSFREKIEKIQELYDILDKYRSMTVTGMSEVQEKTSPETPSEVADEEAEAKTEAETKEVKKVSMDEWDEYDRRGIHIIYEEMLKAALILVNKEGSFKRMDLIEKTEEEVEHDFTDSTMEIYASAHMGYCLDRHWLKRRHKYAPLKKGECYGDGAEELDIDWRVRLSPEEEEELKETMLENRKNMEGTSI